MALCSCQGSESEAYSEHFDNSVRTLPSAHRVDHR